MSNALSAPMLPMTHGDGGFQANCFVALRSRSSAFVAHRSLHFILKTVSGATHLAVTGH
jgi:hypothetical protein